MSITARFLTTSSSDTDPCCTLVYELTAAGVWGAPRCKMPRPRAQTRSPPCAAGTTAVGIGLRPRRRAKSPPMQDPHSREGGGETTKKFKTPFSQYKCQEEIIDILLIRGLIFRTAAQPACFIPHPVIWQGFPQRVGKGRPLAPGRTGVQKNRIRKGPFLASAWSGVVSSGGTQTDVAVEDSKTAGDTEYKGGRWRVGVRYWCACIPPCWAPDWMPDAWCQ